MKSGPTPTDRTSLPALPPLSVGGGHTGRSPVARVGWDRVGGVFGQIQTRHRPAAPFVEDSRGGGGLGWWSVRASVVPGAAEMPSRSCSRSSSSGDRTAAAATATAASRGHLATGAATAAKQCLQRAQVVRMPCKKHATEQSLAGSTRARAPVLTAHCLARAGPCPASPCGSRCPAGGDEGTSCICAS